MEYTFVMSTIDGENLEMRNNKLSAIDDELKIYFIRFDSLNQTITLNGPNAK